MVTCGRPCNIREVLVAESELSCVCDVSWNVSLDKLFTERCSIPGQPRTVSMIGVSGRRVRRPGHTHSISSLKCSEVVVESVILFYDDHNMVNTASTQFSRWYSRTGHRLLVTSNWIYDYPPRSLES